MTKRTDNTQSNFIGDDCYLMTIDVMCQIAVVTVLYVENEQPCSMEKLTDQIVKVNACSNVIHQFNKGPNKSSNSWSDFKAVIRR